ncbi:MAG: hypothetical protein Kow0080_14840 [Candidatus Promineifilaceae bacterium]
MIKKITFLLLPLLILTITACGGSEPAQPTTQPAVQPTIQSAHQPPNPPTVPPAVQATAVPPTTANCAAGSPDQSPLYEHQVYLAASPDGLQFTGQGELIWEHASVPDGVIGPDGKLWVYFINGEPGQHGIFAARQTDSGAWEMVDCVKLDGRFEGNAVDPNVTRLADGRYRLVYYLGSFVGGPPPDPNQPHPIYSAISDDGIHFTVEQQLIAVKGVTDPSLAQLPDGRWLLAMTRNGETLLAASDDGYNFELTGVTITMPGIPELAVLPDGRIILYLSQILLSEDGGQTWTVEEGSFIPGGGADPSLVALPDGGYAFFYKGFSGQPDNPPQGQQGQPDNPPPDDNGMAMYTNAQSAEVLPQADYLAQVNTAANPNSSWQYQTTFIATMPSGQQFDLGSFCRLFQRPDGAGYDVIFGGAFNFHTMEEIRRYQGDVHRLLGNDLTFQTEPVLFSEHGGDLAVDTNGRFYYLLNAHPDGWLLGKYDLNFNLVQELVVPLPEGHAANDQMLRVWNGRLYLSDIYNPDNPDMRSNKDADPDVDLYTHLWIYDTDLNPLEDHILDDEPNINGGTLIPYGDGFAYIAADNFLRNNLKAYIYDAEWHFVRSILLEENAQWSMSGTVAGGRLYIAYHRGRHGQGDVVVDVFDMDWNRLEQIEVTAVAGGFNAQRPWVQVYDDTLFVSYDVGRDSQGIMDLQCLVSVYGHQ